MLAVCHLVQDPGLNERVEALIQDVARDSKALLELVEAGHSQKDITDDQQRPPLANNLEALRD
jgi:hypothetical protein